jgi:hypothetical protein
MMPLRTFRISLFLISLFCFQALYAASTSGQSVSITTFNVRMFGYAKDSEVRDPELVKFFKESIPASDIIVFEEIMDLERFNKIVPAGWACITYEHPMPHQFVMLCHSSRFNFKREPTDDNDVIDEVSGPKNSLRPAVTAIVTDLKGNALFRMVGVHLKALPDFSKTRIEQAEIISRYLEKVQDPTIPVVMAGDFNTYKSDMNGQGENDVDLIQKKLDEAKLNMQHIPNDLFTFRTSWGQSQFDQFYVSHSLISKKPLHIFEVCNSALPGEGVMNLEYYNKMISDHCPVTAEISL